MELSSTRIDKWLWAVRLFKTRSQATDACKKHKVLVNGEPVKASYSVKLNDMIQLKTSPLLTRSFTVLGLIEKRVSAKLAAEHVIETTPPEEFEKLAAVKNNPFALRDRGLGRPTKKDRRDIQRLRDE